MKLLPIGSIIKIKEHKLCIIGYTSMTREDKTQCGYYAVPYPIGYINVEKTLFIPTSMSAEVLAYGYRTEASEKAVELLEIYFNAADTIGPDKVPFVINAYKKAIDNQRKEEE